MNQNTKAGVFNYFWAWGSFEDEWELGVSLADECPYSETLLHSSPFTQSSPPSLWRFSVFSGDPVLKDYKPMNFLMPYVKETCCRAVKEEFNSLNNKLVRKEFHFTYSMTHIWFCINLQVVCFCLFQFPKSWEQHEINHLNGFLSWRLENKLNPWHMLASVLPQRTHSSLSLWTILKWTRWRY